MQKFVNVTDSALLHLIDSNHIQAPRVSSSERASESDISPRAPGFSLVAFIGWSNSDVLAAFGSEQHLGQSSCDGTRVDPAGRILGSVSVTTVSLQLDETRKFAAGCFTQAPSF